MARNHEKPLLQRIADGTGTFSQKQEVLAKYLEKNYKELAYTTLVQLAKLAGVSETTVVRFVAKLGYKGFPDFKKGLRRAIKDASDQEMRMHKYDFREEEYEFPKDICKAVFTLEMKVMQSTLAKIDLDDHAKAVDMLHKATEVFIVACGANTCCSQAMGFALQVIKPNVHIIEHRGLPERALIQSALKGAVAVVFTTPRYPAPTQQITEMLKDRGIKIIGVSDSLLSPLVPYSDIYFQVPEKYLAFIDTNAAYMALIHSFAFALYYKNKPKARDMIDEYDDFVRKYDYYDRADADLVDPDYHNF